MSFQGIHVTRYITSHGIALNCNTNLDWFKHIIPCGIADKSVTSLTEEYFRSSGNRSNITVDDVIPGVIKEFGDSFKSLMVPLEQDHPIIANEIDKYDKRP